MICMQLFIYSFKVSYPEGRISTKIFHFLSLLQLSIWNYKLYSGTLQVTAVKLIISADDEYAPTSQFGHHIQTLEK